MLTNIEARMLKKDEDATVEALPYSATTLPLTVTVTPTLTPTLNSNANPHPNQVDTMLSRMWTAESEKAVTAALIDEYAVAATTAVGTEKRELEDERKGLEVKMKGVEDSSAAAQAILYEGGNGDLMKQVMMMMAEMKATLVEVRQE